ncbi:BRO family protein [uncultured Desulfovibrio sp.]|uniref:BRO-N domain-containing protein n=1 Tax=uncultured Desulfovibrio sp. TaxID=167968 RepID=UPI00258DDB60|nr:BRO family protein [uncultured Desulfovibrio sp.]
MTTALTFNSISLTPITHQNSLWIRAAELARALGFTREDKVAQIYQRHADEFTPDMTQLIEIVAEPQNGVLANGRARIFSLRGCHLLAMFARTPVAKSFRRWVLDVLDKLAEQERARLAEPVRNPDRLTSTDSLSTAASRKPLRALVHAWAQISGTPHTALWPQVKAHFQLERIDDLPEEWIPDALEWVQGKIDEQRQALPPSPGSNPGQSRPTPAPIWNRAAPALAITDEIDVHLAAIREHIRHINDHEEAIFHAVRKGMPPLSGTGPRSSLALQIRRNMENAGWSLHYALKSMEASARTALAAGRI